MGTSPSSDAGGVGAALVVQGAAAISGPLTLDLSGIGNLDQPLTLQLVQANSVVGVFSGVAVAGGPQLLACEMLTAQPVYTPTSVSVTLSRNSQRCDDERNLALGLGIGLGVAALAGIAIGVCVAYRQRREVSSFQKKAQAEIMERDMYNMQAMQQQQLG